MPWHYAVEGEQRGPVTDQEFEQLVRSGAIRPDTRVWQPGMGDWQTYASLTGGGARPSAAKFGGFWIRFVAKIIDGLALYAIMIPANMVAAVMVYDSANFWAATRVQPGQPPDFAKMIAFQSIVFPLGIIVAIAYSWFFISRFDATPGKMALGLKVLRADGTKLSTGVIIGRYFGEWLSWLTLTIGFIIAGFDDEKRTLHDRICGTRVFRAR